MKDSEGDVVKSNALVEAVHSPSSIYQMRLFLAALMQVKAKGELDYRTVYTVSARSLAKLVGNKSVDNYSELERAANQLVNATVSLSEDQDGKPIESGWLKVNIVSSCRYREKEGCVDLRFTPDILPYISSLKHRFTQYQAENVMPMRSAYGVRLYELCLSWMGEERMFTVDSFREIMGVKGQYPEMNNLKRRVLNPALQDINTHSDISVKFNQLKRGRTVTHFVFSITRPVKTTPPVLATLSFEKWADRFEYNRGYSSFKKLEMDHFDEYKKYRKDPVKWVRANASDSRIKQAEKEQRELDISYFSDPNKALPDEEQIDLELILKN